MYFKFYHVEGMLQMFIILFTFPIVNMFVNSKQFVKPLYLWYIFEMLEETEKKNIYYIRCVRFGFIV